MAFYLLVTLHTHLTECLVEIHKESHEECLIEVIFDAR